MFGKRRFSDNEGRRKLNSKVSRKIARKLRSAVNLLMEKDVEELEEKIVKIRMVKF